MSATEPQPGCLELFQGPEDFARFTDVYERIVRAYGATMPSADFLAELERVRASGDLFSFKSRNSEQQATVQYFSKLRDSPAMDRASVTKRLDEITKQSRGLLEAVDGVVKETEIPKSPFIDLLATWRQGSEFQFSSDFKHAIAKPYASKISIWDMETGEAVAFGSSAELSGYRASADFKTVATVAGDRFTVWDGKTGGVLREIVTNVKTPSFVRISPDLSKGLVSAWDGRMELWDLVKGTRIYELPSGARLTHVLVSSDFKYALSVTGAGWSYWNLEKGTSIFKSGFEINAGDPLVANSDFSRIAFGSKDGYLQIWNPKTGENSKKRGAKWTWLTRNKLAPTSKIYASPDFERLITVSERNELAFWNGANARLIRTIDGTRIPASFRGFEGDFKLVGFTPDFEKLVVSRVKPERLEVLDAKTGETLSSYTHAGSEITAMSFSADSKIVYAADGSGNLSSWSIATGKPIIRFPQGDPQIYSIHLSPDESKAVVSSTRALASGI